MNFRKITVHPVARHLGAVAAWGALAIVIFLLQMTVNVNMLLAVRSGRFPWAESVWTVAGWFYDVLWFPAMWVKPQTVFDDDRWLMLFIGLFWGVAVHFAPAALKGFWRNRRRVFRYAALLFFLGAAGSLCLYPAATVGFLLLADTKLPEEGQSRLVPVWFNGLAGRYADWATGYLNSRRALTVSKWDVAGTEWPMFGSVLFLVTAGELQKQGLVDARQGKVRRAVEKAREIVVSPNTAAWVKARWGDDYLKRENVFYRMLLIMGAAAYEEITGDIRHKTVMAWQWRSLAEELERAPFHVLDDYPGDCWPSDVLWAVAAIRRAAALEGLPHDTLARSLLGAFDGPLSVSGLPVFRTDKTTGAPLEPPRGCGNSGILCFAAELDPAVAARWFKEHESQFWKENLWLAGFTEFPKGTVPAFSDVDSGPVFCEFGSVASAFGIGAAKSVGRMDRAVPLTLEAVACSWPTPFGFLVPMAMGERAADGACLAETALLFSMTRPNRLEQTVIFRGHAPLLVWVLFFVYIGTGAGCIFIILRRLYRPARPIKNKVLNHET
jgi:hypothetical protein